MPLMIQIIASPEGEAVTELTASFPESGGTIGRSAGSSLQLTDSRRIISGTHAVIERQGEKYHIKDVSRNGLFINDSKKAVGKSNFSVISDGDVLTIGEYRLLVSSFDLDEPANKSTKRQTNNLSYSSSEDPFSGEAHFDSVFEHKDDPFVGRVEPTVDDDVSTEIVLSVEGDPFDDGTTVSKQNTSNPPQVDEHDPFSDDPFKEDSHLEDYVKSDISSKQNNNLEKEVNNQQQEPIPKPIVADQPVSNEPVMLPDTNHKGRRQHQSDLQAVVFRSLEAALHRFLKEISPEHLESLFNDYYEPGLFKRKPDYWKLYKKHFSRMAKDEDYHLKFKAYFVENYKRMSSQKGGDE